MADEINGEIPIDSTEDEASDSKVQVLVQKIESLEEEKQLLIEENEAKMKELNDQIEASHKDKKFLESIAARAADLEAEVSRLQHDLISSSSEAQDANAELVELKSVVVELKKSGSEKEKNLEAIEKERDLLLEKLGNDSEGVEKFKAESEGRIKELEKKVEALEAERVIVEEELKAKLEKKDVEIRDLKKTVDELRSVIAKNRADMERLKKERDELEIVKNELEALLKKSERKVSEMEPKIDQLQKELEASENIIKSLKDATVSGSTNGVLLDRGVVLGEEKRISGLKPEWPVLAASAGAIAVVAVVYFRYASQKY